MAKKNAVRGTVLLSVLLVALMLAIGGVAGLYVYRVKTVQGRQSNRMHALQIAGNILAEIRSRLQEEPQLVKAGAEEHPRPVENVEQRSRYLGVWEHRPLEQQIPVVKSARSGFSSRVTMDTSGPIGSRPAEQSRHVTVEVTWPGGSVSMGSTVRTSSGGSWFDGSGDEGAP